MLRFVSWSRISCFPEVEIHIQCCQSRVEEDFSQDAARTEESKSALLPSGLGICFLPGVEDGSLLDPRKNFVPIAKDVQPTYDLCCKRTEHLDGTELRDLHRLLHEDEATLRGGGDRDNEQGSCGSSSSQRSSQRTSAHQQAAAQGERTTTSCDAGEGRATRITAARESFLLEKLLTQGNPSASWDDDSDAMWPPQYEREKYAAVSLPHGDHTRVVYRKQLGALYHLKALLDYGDRPVRMESLMPWLRDRGFFEIGAAADEPGEPGGAPADGSGEAKEREPIEFGWWFRGGSILDYDGPEPRQERKERLAKLRETGFREERKEVLTTAASGNRAVDEESPRIKTEGDERLRLTWRGSAGLQAGSRTLERPPRNVRKGKRATRRDQDTETLALELDEVRGRQTTGADAETDVPLGFLMHLATVLELDLLQEQASLLEDLDTLQGPLARGEDPPQGLVTAVYEPWVEDQMREPVLYHCGQQMAGARSAERAAEARSRGDEQQQEEGAAGGTSTAGTTATTEATEEGTPFFGCWRNSAVGTTGDAAGEAPKDPSKTFIPQRQGSGYNPFQNQWMLQRDELWNWEVVKMFAPRDSSSFVEDGSKSAAAFAKEKAQEMLEKLSVRLRAGGGDGLADGGEEKRAAVAEELTGPLAGEIRRVDVAKGRLGKVPQEFLAAYEKRFLPGSVKAAARTMVAQNGVGSFSANDFVRIVLAFFESSEIGGEQVKMPEERKTGAGAATEQSSDAISTSVQARVDAIESDRNGRQARLSAKFLIYWIWLERIGFPLLLMLSRPLAVAVQLVRLHLLRAVSLCRVQLFAWQLKEWLSKHLRAYATLRGSGGEGDHESQADATAEDVEDVHAVHPELVREHPAESSDESSSSGLEDSALDDLFGSSDESASTSTSSVSEGHEVSLLQHAPPKNAPRRRGALALVDSESELLERLLRVLEQHTLDFQHGSVDDYMRGVCSKYGRGSRLVWEDCSCSALPNVGPLDVTARPATEHNEESAPAVEEDPGQAKASRLSVAASSCGDRLAFARAQTSGEVDDAGAGQSVREHHYYRGAQIKERADSISVMGTGFWNDDEHSATQRLMWAGRLALPPGVKRISIDVVIPVCAFGDVEDLDVSVFPGWSRIFFYDLCGEFSRFLPPDVEPKRHPNTETSFAEFHKTTTMKEYRLFSVAELLTDEEDAVWGVDGSSAADKDEKPTPKLRPAVRTWDAATRRTKLLEDPLAKDLIDRCAKFRADSVFFDDSHEEDVRTLDVGVRFFHLAKHYEDVADVTFMAHADWREHATPGIMQASFEAIERGHEWDEELQGIDVVHLGKRQHGPLFATAGAGTSEKRFSFSSAQIEEVQAKLEQGVGQLKHGYDLEQRVDNRDDTAERQKAAAEVAERILIADEDAAARLGSDVRDVAARPDHHFGGFVAPETFVYHAVELEGGSMGEFLGREDWDLATGFFDPDRKNDQSAASMWAAPAAIHAARAKTFARELVAGDTELSIADTQEGGGGKQDGEEAGRRPMATTFVMKAVPVGTPSDQRRQRRTYANQRKSGSQNLRSTRFLARRRQNPITRNKPSYRLPDAYEANLHRKVWRILFQEEFELPKHHFGGYDYGVFLLSRRAVFSRARSWYAHVAYGLQSARDTWGMLAESGGRGASGAGGGSSYFGPAAAASRGNAGHFVSVRTDISSTPRIYNKAVCMIFEHLWSVLFAFVPSMPSSSSPAPPAPTSRSTATAGAPQPEKFRFGYRGGLGTAGGPASILLKSRFYDSALPLALRLEWHPAARSIVHFENLWRYSRLSLLRIDQRCVLQKFLSEEPTLYLPKTVLPQYPRICFAAAGEEGSRR